MLKKYRVSKSDEKSFSESPVCCRCGGSEKVGPSQEVLYDIKGGMPTMAVNSLPVMVPYCDECSRKRTSTLSTEQLIKKYQWMTIVLGIAIGLGMFISGNPDLVLYGIASLFTGFILYYLATMVRMLMVNNNSISFDKNSIYSESVIYNIEESILSRLKGGSPE